MAVAESPVIRAGSAPKESVCSHVKRDSTTAAVIVLIFRPTGLTAASAVRSVHLVKSVLRESANSHVRKVLLIVQVSA